MSKRRTEQAKARAKKKAEREHDQQHPGGKSRYARKNRERERGRGYSTRIASPFYMSPSAVASARRVPEPASEPGTEAAA